MIIWKGENMAILSTLIVGVVLFALGHLLVRFIGWPRTLTDGVKWSALLFVLSVAATGFPQLVEAVASRLGSLPDVSAGDFLASVSIIGLAVLGYVAWRTGEDHVRNEQRLQARRRALPPPPAGHQGDHVFTLIDPPTGDE